MLKIHQIITSIDQPLTIKDIAKKLHCKDNDILSYDIDKQSLDVRRQEMHYSYTVYATVKNEQRYLKNKDVIEAEKEEYTLPDQPHSISDRPVIVGFGPSGMFAGLILAECGLKPIIIERGKRAAERSKDVQQFFTKGILNTESNVQYGEGGAGTFSDGKLTTRMKNIRISKVLNEFVEAGADQAITYQHRPHLGTEVLQDIVVNIRKKIIALGGEVQFSTRLDSLDIKNNKIIGIHTNNGYIPCSKVLLCCGHSASETYTSLYNQGVPIYSKDFAIGVRVEHPQSLIDQLTYKQYYGNPHLDPASYRLAYHSSNGRGVYSFCMCPGGVVVPASTHEHTLVVNGMSYSNRDGHNANSAILVQIPKADFDHSNPLDGFIYQTTLEQSAYRSHYQAPTQNIKDYIHNTTSNSLVINSSYPLGNSIEDMQKLFNEEVNQSLKEGFTYFNKKMPGFIDQGIMEGVESRSSSPIRLIRNDDGQSLNCEGLYPCGEGAGYAGGIISSAVDGIKQAEQVIHSYE